MPILFWEAVITILKALERSVKIQRTFFTYVISNSLFFAIYLFCLFSFFYWFIQAIYFFRAILMRDSFAFSCSTYSISRSAMQSGDFLVSSITSHTVSAAHHTNGPRCSSTHRCVSKIGFPFTSLTA